MVDASGGFMRSILLGLVAMTSVGAVGTMTAQVASKTADVRSSASIMDEAKVLLAKAQAAPNGMAQAKFETYPGHQTLLTVRVKDGEAESHSSLSDWFIVEEGEATVVTGGKIADSKEISPGQIHGSKIVGGTSQVVHKGDVVHISPNVPHQMLVPVGKPFIYYVVKVDKPLSGI